MTFFIIIIIYIVARKEKQKKKSIPRLIGYRTVLGVRMVLPRSKNQGANARARDVTHLTHRASLSVGQETHRLN